MPPPVVSLADCALFFCPWKPRRARAAGAAAAGRRAGSRPGEPRLFGVSLQELQQRGLAENGVPTAVRGVVEYLARHGLTQEGLFRVNGNMKVVEHLRMQMENGVHLQLGAQGEEQVRAAASLLKLFLRLLPERVIPASLQPRFLQLLQDRSNGVQETSLRDLLKELPDSHYSLLKYLCGFLTQVAANHVYNRMDIHNLATIFGPNFFQ
ncbi:PREDICTED: protein FAM13A-like [Dipodomys ordii]|uniref:Protein FAM13A-like n=1 Tax=Dipodomys ordii TaxID=10020 RepID=A0A1S3GA98_DIPOR|nr:PREDICTED: protein FAM13A-like [Dipodomys ordii]